MLVLTLLSALDTTLEPVAADGYADLIERARRLDDAAWQSIYDQHYPRLYGYLYYRTGDTEQAEELTAQVFERAVKHINRYHERGTGLGAWLQRIAQNLAHDAYRRRKTAPPDPLELNESWLSAGADPAQRAVLNESRRLLYHAIHQLTPEQRDVILLRFIAQMTAPEIADTLGKTTGSIKALQHRALAALRRELEALNYHGLS